MLTFWITAIVIESILCEKSFDSSAVIEKPFVKSFLQNRSTHKMSNINKINYTQKAILANFMAEHPDLAKNRLTNCGQAKAVSHKLWEQLTLKLNASGPPVKNCTLWKKVFADQKHNAKKKLSFNKSSKQQTGGGPYEEKTLTSAEELIVEAAGLTPAVDGLANVTSFGSAAIQVRELSETENEYSVESHSSTKRQKQTAVKEDTKLTILRENIEKSEDWHKEISFKLEKLIEIEKNKNNKLDEIISLKERALRLKEAEHKASMATKKMDLEIKCLELEALKQNCLQNY